MENIFGKSTYDEFLQAVNEFNKKNKSYKEIIFLKNTFDNLKINIEYINQYIKDENPHGYDIILIYLFDRLEKNKLDEKLDKNYIEFLYNDTLYKKYIDQVNNEVDLSKLPKNFLTLHNSRFDLTLSYNLYSLMDLKIKLSEILKKEIEHNDIIFSNISEFHTCFNNLSKLLDVKFIILNSFYGLDIKKNDPYLYQYIDFNKLKSIKINSPIFIDKDKLKFDYSFFKNKIIPCNEIDVVKDMYEYGTSSNIIVLECYGINLFRFLIKRDNFILTKEDLIVNDKFNNKMINNIVKHIEFITNTQCVEKCIPYEIYNEIFGSLGELNFKSNMHNTFSLTSSDLINMKKKIITDLELIKMKNKKSNLNEILIIYTEKINFMKTPIMMKIKFLIDYFMKKINENMYLNFDPNRDLALFDLLIFMKQIINM